ncbi:MAG: hypothetical protein H7Y13_06835 [Sphingobacteriaceae bacterium]|nr:hypothetical protein [Sphingobacteriaceae bacterium]
MNLSIQNISKYLFPILVIIFAIFYLTNEPLYREFISEDHFVEWLTFLFLILTGFSSAILANRIKHRHNYLHWFFIVFSGFCILAGFEEISWGQRVFDVETTEFFQRHSDQKEINLHNTFQGTVGIKTKHIALLAMFIYGVLLPWREKKGDQHVEWLKAHYLIIPPLFLIPGFLMATALMLDFQTGYEEEIGEFFFSICFFLMIQWNHRLFKTTPTFRSPGFGVIKQKPLLQSKST